VSTGIEREQLRHPVDLLTQRLHQLFHALTVPLPSPFSILRMSRLRSSLTMTCKGPFVLWHITSIPGLIERGRYRRVTGLPREIGKTAAHKA
jgi:hypothetical protein